MQLNKYTVLEVYSLQSKIILKLLVNIVQPETGRIDYDSIPLVTRARQSRDLTPKRIPYPWGVSGPVAYPKRDSTAITVFTYLPTGFSASTVCRSQ